MIFYVVICKQYPQATPTPEKRKEKKMLDSLMFNYRWTNLQHSYKWEREKEKRQRVLETVRIMKTRLEETDKLKQLLPVASIHLKSRYSSNDVIRYYNITRQYQNKSCT